ncbi:MFS transporter [Romboutsia sp. 13368]|uniref:MFS transporter n=1 Tax=Romboutsia sp. 13368 TaxID=2708053 RepID=UPI0025E6607C|nr:MFS transporter [Romboutsia sp. 13368]
MRALLFKISYFFLFFGSATIGGMLIPFLQYKGFEPIQIGSLISLYTLIGLVGLFSVGYFCDKLKTIKKILLPSLIITIIAGSVAVIFNKGAIFYIGFFLMGLFSSMLGSLCDSWVMESDEDTKSKFGAMRAFGSVGWAFGVLSVGFIISNFGYKYVTFLYIGTLLVAAFASFKLKDVIKNSSGSISFKPLLTNKDYIFTIITLLIICIGFRGYLQLIPYGIARAGGNTSNLGVFNFICSVSEIAMMILCNKIMHKLSPDKLLILSPIGVLMQMLVLYFIPNIYAIYLSGLLQVFTYPIILIVGRTMIDRVCPENLKTTSQLIGFALSNNLGIIIGSFVVGFLIEYFNIEKAIFIMMIVVVLGILITIFYDRKTKDKTI